LGPAAYRFADFLAATGQKYWQILPLNPTDPALDSNPYHSTSAFALNPLLISPEKLAENGLIDVPDPDNSEEISMKYADFIYAHAIREQVLSHAFEQFTRQDDRREYDQFVRENAWWLDSYTLFTAIRKDRGGEPWNRWPDDLKHRNPESLHREHERLFWKIEHERFLQFIVAMQWRDFRNYCNSRGIRIIGDIPIYVDYDSADVWNHPGFFKLDTDLRPTVVAGVPPDYFSATGQLWYNPVYRWDALKKDKFSWWVQRIGRNLDLVDYLRIDHFRGLVACWEVPAGAKTAMDGRWVEAPAEAFLKTLARTFACLPIIAEDLGVITPDVREVMRHFSIPGMAVLLFAFEDDFPNGPYLPHNVARDSVMYTGTHDNNPVLGWALQEATSERLDRIRRYFGREIPNSELHWAFIRVIMASVAGTVIIPLQDILGLGPESRMNRPGINSGNWKWRFTEEMLTRETRERLYDMTVTFARD
jgi:4-alpha-glucanotransferase